MEYNRFQIVCVFAEYDLFKLLLYKISYINRFSYNFDTVLYQFLETGISDMCIVQRLRFSGFILYPLSFFLYSPFKNELSTKLKVQTKRYLFYPNRLLSTIGDNREMNQLYMTSQVSNITRKATVYLHLCMSNMHIYINF